MTWTIPKLWDRSTCVILGGGPGLRTDLMDRVRDSGFRSVAVNNAWKVAPWADVLYYGDCNWLRMPGNEEGTRSFGGIVVTRCQNHSTRPWIKVVTHHTAARVGISTDPTRLHWHFSSGAAAINLAVLLGAGKLILMGFDMRDVDGCRNWHKDYPQAKRNVFPNFMRGFPGIAAHLEKLGIPCVNATPGSALTAFPIVTPEEVLCSASSASTNPAGTSAPFTLPGCCPASAGT